MKTRLELQSVKAAQSKGIVYITNLSNLRKVPKENNYFFLTTQGKREIDGVKYLPELAPSKNLFNKYLNQWKHKESSFWWKDYCNQYKKEINTEYINKLEEGLNQGKNVTLICFCGDETICHRSILKEIFQQKGFKTISITKGDK